MPTGSVRLSPPDGGARNRGYWEGNLDVQNLGGDGSGADPAAALRRELPFLEAPDQRAVLAHIAPAAGMRILDLGTGLGVMAARLAEAGATVIAADLAGARLAQARAGLLALLGRESSGRVCYVQCRAEALPFRECALDGAATRAVLIHTRVEESAAELARVLRPGARYAFAEPLRGNPFARLYRATLAPSEWRAITTYFGAAECAAVGRHLPGAQEQRFYIFAFLAFVFQFAVAWPTAFRAAVRVLGAADALLMRAVPAVRAWCWFTVLAGTRPPTER